VLDAIAAAGELNVSLAYIPSERVTMHMGQPLARTQMAEVLKVYVEECGHEVVGTVTGGGLAVIQAFARFEPDAVLLGRGSEAFAAAFLAGHPEFVGRVRASGVVPPDVVAGTLASCDVLLQPYPDGITVRRTSAMAGLAQGRPIVTTTGHLTEPSWAEQGAVALVPVLDVEGFAASAEHLLTDAEERARLGARARTVYHAHFSVGHLVRTLLAVA